MALLRHCLETLRAREREMQTRTFVGVTVKTRPLAEVAQIDELERLMLRPASSSSTADASSPVARRKAA